MAIVMVFALVGCRSTDTPASTPAETPAAESPAAEAQLRKAETIR